MIVDNKMSQTLMGITETDRPAQTLVTHATYSTKGVGDRVMDIAGANLILYYETHASTRGDACHRYNLNRDRSHCVNFNTRKE